MPDLSVVVLALDDTPRLHACLRGLADSEVLPTEVVVVDGSSGAHLPDLLGHEFPAVRVVRNPAGPRARRLARRIGAAATTGDVVAFLDGDAVPDRRWLGTLQGHFADPGVAGAGGRLLSRDLSRLPVQELPGRVLADGRLVANFRVDLGRPAQVHHLSGVNMSFRRTALDGLCGREYPGTAEWEDADVCWQVRAGGGQLVFDPSAVVRYEPGSPRVGGQERSRPVRYHYSTRNNAALLIRRERGNALVGRFVRSTLRAQLDHVHSASQLLRHGPMESRRPTRVREALQQLALIGGEVSGLLLGAVDGMLGHAEGWRARAPIGKWP